MAGLAVFLAPISSILACDYWLVKHKKLDVPSLYRRHARYKYQHGINWRAAVAFLVSVTPNIPGYVGEFQSCNGVHTNKTFFQPRKSGQSQHLVVVELSYL